MTRLTVFLASVLIFSLSAGIVTAEISGGFDMVTPAGNTFIESKILGIALVAKKTAPDTFRISINGKPYSEVKKNGSYFICRTVDLQYGPNSISVENLNKGKLIERKQYEIFVRTDLMTENTVPPAQFQRYYFHIPQNERACVPCHSLDNIQSDNLPGSPPESPCFPCHKRITSSRFVHGPAAVWACTSCHKRKSKKTGYESDEPVNKSCFPCHDEAMTKWNGQEYLHGPFATGNCSVCHDPHSSDNPFWLRKKTTDLCVSCHVDKGSTPHVVEGFDGLGHPIRGKPNPADPRTELSCASCHNPHSSVYESLLKWDTERKKFFCRQCHF